MRTLLTSTASEDPDPLIKSNENKGAFFQDEEAALLSQAPADKHTEIKEWFTQRRSSNISPETFKQELETFKQLLDYFFESIKRVEKTLETKDVSVEMKDFFYRAFSSKCDLLRFSITDLKDRENKFADHWNQFWDMRERVKNLTGEGGQFQDWLEEEWKKPNFSMTKLLESLWDKYNDLKKNFKKNTRNSKAKKIIFDLKSCRGFLMKPIKRHGRKELMNAVKKESQNLMNVLRIYNRNVRKS